ncbi:MAG: hypothetical protein WC829_17500 [Hyphomicrobium sp.]|jgi:hypothetical protein
MPRSSVLVLIGILAGVIAAQPARAEEICVACDEPTATYRCTVEQPSEKHQLGGSLEQEICAKVLAKKGPHQNCHVAIPPEGKTCAGTERIVSLTDYQRAIAGTGESTYEVGAFEIARRNVHETWTCMMSMFKDC